MSIQDWVQVLTLMIAGYAAVVSTILAVRESQKEKRRLKIIIEFWRWSYSSRIAVTNIGHRPIS